jgi:hypothetical protein
MATKAYSDGYAAGLSDVNYAEASAKHDYKGREEGLWIAVTGGELRTGYTTDAMCPGTKISNSTLSFCSKLNRQSRHRSGIRSERPSTTLLRKVCSLMQTAATHGPASWKAGVKPASGDTSRCAEMTDGDAAHPSANSPFLVAFERRPTFCVVKAAHIRFSSLRGPVRSLAMRSKFVAEDLKGRPRQLHCEHHRRMDMI